MDLVEEIVKADRNEKSRVKLKKLSDEKIAREEALRKKGYLFIMARSKKKREDIIKSLPRRER